MALDLPADARAALPTPPAPFRAVPAASLHVTLAFLGPRDEGDAERAAAALAPPPAGELSTSGVVLLPARRPRVMAVRLDDPSGDCRRCQAAVERDLVRAGLQEPERRPWLPHVTIGRARERVGPRTACPAAPPLAFRPPSVTLYRSVPSPGGARYEALRSWRV